MLIDKIKAVLLINHTVYLTLLLSSDFKSTPSGSYYLVVQLTFYNETCLLLQKQVHCD